MFTLKVEALTGEILTLTQNESDYQITNIDGLNPPKAIINTSNVAGMDGNKFNSARLEGRNIVITLRLNGNVEKNRIKLYRYFRTKQWCKIYYKNSSRDVYIEGYVESIETDLFSQSEIMQISILCQNPYFQDAQEIVDDISKVVKEFEFPFAFGDNGATQDGIEIVESDLDDAKEFSTYEYERVTEIFNESENETGVIINITFTATVNSPKIIDTITGEYFELRGTYNVGDEVVINTNKGNKSVKLIRNGIESSLFGNLVLGSTWFQLRVGSNYYSYSATRNDTFMRVIYKHNNIYEGV